MFVIRKRINGLNVRVHVSTSEFESRVSGSVFPFGRQFHAVTFAATREVDLSTAEMKVAAAKPEIGFGGNQHKGENAALVIKAAEVALDQANYYAFLNNAIACGEHLSILVDLIDCGDQEGVIDALLLSPRKVPDHQKDVEIAFRKLIEDASIFGLQGILTSDRLDELSRANPNAFFGLMRLAERFESYGARDGNREERIEATRNLIDKTIEDYISKG